MPDAASGDEYVMDKLHHDLGVIRRELTKARRDGFKVEQIIASSRRAPDGMSLFGLPVATDEDLGPNYVRFVALGREPRMIDLGVGDE